jgi:hypothetical protein
MRLVQHKHLLQGAEPDSCSALIHRAKQVRAPIQSHRVTYDNRHDHTHKMK